MWVALAVSIASLDGGSSWSQQIELICGHQPAAVRSLLEPLRHSATLAAQSCLAFGELTCRMGRVWLPSKPGGFAGGHAI